MPLYENPMPLGVGVSIWDFYFKKITLAEMQAAVREIMTREGKLPI